MMNTPPENDSLQEPDPAAYIPFRSHNEAVHALGQVGYAGTDRVFNFKSSDLTSEVNNLLENEGIVMMDLTSTIPETPHAAYQALTVAGFNAAASCRKDNNAAFLIMRTESNTPSFLFGQHWGCCQTFGKSVADKHVQESPTPAAFVVFRERQISIPTSACDADVAVVSKMIAYYITLKEEYFRCSICKTPFITKDKAGEHLAEIAVNTNGHMFLRSCVETLSKDTDTSELIES